MGRTRRTKALRKKTRRGGKFLAQGKTAVVIDPPISCKDGRDMSKYVSRVSKREKYEDLVSKDHPRLIKKLKELDPDQQYFYYPEYCTPGNLSEDNKLDGITYKNKKYSEILLKGSNEWNPISNKARSWVGFLKGKARGKKLPMTAKTQEQLDHLAKAIKLLHDNGIVHGDLHGRNVIMADDEMPRIIDFEYALVDTKEKHIEAEKSYIEDAWPSLDPTWRLSR
jgi:serine/threonine protein kinase